MRCYFTTIRCLGGPQIEATEYFNRAAALAPDNSDYISHIYDAALDAWDFEATDSLAILDYEISGREDTWEWLKHMRGITNRAKGDSSWSISEPGLMNTLLTASRLAKGRNPC